ncbi:pantetheine-phosphate adenylyltransferase [Capnocytophaga sp. oral taxon 863 str. F0517]|jgi:pantetheine-phosphate adenylyltransferase|uniref:pantetheine-phosphate adenylyltransferase n=1 Tax=Capnocytophaga sp. oral taxon 863 TaxID=1227265 RepID=UPI000396F450|nr:pantetheine-phosphate adenylyltransferase [Capnocytophaga sp. oral taxon 863]ERI63302.1 pantetheine-phosphate adenylyltransferase [Capnocytophaga sp. oral taxon 863 str. F0517]
MKKVVFPGSFDPITLGHYDIICRATELFDEIIVAVGENADKRYMFSVEQRMDFIAKCFADYKRVKIVSYQGLTVDFCKRLQIPFILRGLRNPADFEFERAIAHTNRDLAGVETVFLLTAVKTSHISSSIVRDVIRNRGDYTRLVPERVRIENIEDYYIHP